MTWLTKNSAPPDASEAETVDSIGESVTAGVVTPLPTAASAASPVTADAAVLSRTQESQLLSQSPPDFGVRYTVQCMLGEGGMGTVYKAWDKELERTVALKLIRRDLTRDAEIIRRFKQELLLASKISHSNVLRIHDLGDGPAHTKFISMAFVEGQDLAQLLKKQGKLPLDPALHIARQLCSALEAAHTEGVVHRDRPRTDNRQDFSEK